MTSPESYDNPPAIPAEVAAEIGDMLDTPDDPERRMALPHEVAPEATDYLAGVEEVAMNGITRARFVGEDIQSEEHNHKPRPTAGIKPKHTVLKPVIVNPEYL